MSACRGSSGTARYALSNYLVSRDFDKKLAKLSANLPIIKTIIHELQSRGTATLSELEAAIMDEAAEWQESEDYVLSEIQEELDSGYLLVYGLKVQLKGHSSTSSQGVIGSRA